MRNIIKKSLAVGSVSGLMLVGGAGMANANSGDSTETHVDEVAQVTDNTITDSGNLSLDNILNDGVVDIDDTANGNNTNVDVSPNADSDVDADTSADTTTDGGEDNEGLLGGLL